MLSEIRAGGGSARIGAHFGFPVVPFGELEQFQLPRCVDILHIVRVDILRRFEKLYV
jgi:hypothetical protein